jgi:hypothetical protein
LRVDVVSTGVAASPATNGGDVVITVHTVNTPPSMTWFAHRLDDGGHVIAKRQVFMQSPQFLPMTDPPTVLFEAQPGRYLFALGDQVFALDDGLDVLWIASIGSATSGFAVDAVAIGPSPVAGAWARVTNCDDAGQLRWVDVHPDGSFAPGPTLPNLGQGARMIAARDGGIFTFRGNSMPERYDAGGSPLWHSVDPVERAAEVADGFVLATHDAPPFALVHVDAFGTARTLATLPVGAGTVLLIDDAGVLTDAPGGQLIWFGLDGAQRWMRPDDILRTLTRDGHTAAADPRGGAIVGGGTDNCEMPPMPPQFADYAADGTQRWQASTIAP